MRASEASDLARNARTKRNATAVLEAKEKLPSLLGLIKERAELGETVLRIEYSQLFGAGVTPFFCMAIIDQLKALGYTVGHTEYGPENLRISW